MFRLELAQTAVLFILCWSLPVNGQLKVKFRGTEVISESTLRQVIHKTLHGSCHKAGLRAARRAIRYYRRKGYKLARARYSCKKGLLTLEIDEGRLGKIIVKGTDVFQGVLFQVGIKLPGKVYHPKTLRLKMIEVRRKYRLNSIRYRLVRSDIRSRSQQWGEPMYDLYIHVKTKRRRSGLILNVEYSSEYGVLGRVGYKLANAGLRRSEWRIVVGVGVDLVKAIEKKDARRLWSHAAFNTAYSFPAFWRRIVRPSIAIFTDISVLSRPDVYLDEYYYWRVGVRFNTDLILKRWVSLRIGGMFLYRRIFRVTVEKDKQSAIDAFQRIGGSVYLESHFNFLPQIRRLDQRTLLVAHLSHHFQRAKRDYQKAEIRFQHYFHFAYHDLILRTRGFWLFGTPDFTDLIGLAGSHLRTFFAGKYYGRAAWQFTAEVRFGVYRDIFKMGLFSDTSIFGRLDQETTRRAIVATSFGPGLHFLLFDVIQIDFYYTFGFAEKNFSHNLYFKLAKVF